MSGKPPCIIHAYSTASAQNPLLHSHTSRTFAAAVSMARDPDSTSLMQSVNRSTKSQTARLRYSYEALLDVCCTLWMVHWACWGRRFSREKLQWPHSIPAFANPSSFSLWAHPQIQYERMKYSRVQSPCLITLCCCFEFYKDTHTGISSSFSCRLQILVSSRLRASPARALRIVLNIHVCIHLTSILYMEYNHKPCDLDSCAMFEENLAIGPLVFFSQKFSFFKSQVDKAD